MRHGFLLSVCLGLISLVGPRAALGGNPPPAPAPAPAPTSASALTQADRALFVWWDSLGFPDVGRLPFVRYWSGSWHRRAGEVPTQTGAPASLVADDTTTFEVFTLELVGTRAEKRQIEGEPWNRMGFDPVDLAMVVEGRLAGAADSLVPNGWENLLLARACAAKGREDDSHAGHESRGEGVLGLVRALLEAGATDVVCSTWQVADAPTLDLMLHFHGARAKEGLSPTAALRAARLHLMRAPVTADPAHWAGFQCWGSGAR